MSEKAISFNNSGPLKASFQEIVTSCSMSRWTLTGKNAVVKVVRLEEGLTTLQRGKVKGYVTQARFLKGLNALQIERDLGLRPCSMNRGLIVFYFERLPRAQEVQQRYAASMPDGKLWTDVDFDAHMRAIDARLKSTSDIVESYPPGSPRVLQWQLMDYVPISKYCRTVMPSLPFHID